MSPPIPAAAVTLLTAETRGAIAAVRVWGTSALALASSVFRPFRGASLAETRPGEVRYGRVGRGLGDEVVVVITADTPAEVEIHCHGGPAAVELVMSAMIDAGATRLDWSNWVASRSRPRLRNEANEDLPRAPTVRMAEILLDQSDGALDRELLELDRRIAEDQHLAVGTVETLLRRSEVGRRLLGGWKIALVGLPNVGKSRLLNAFAGFDRSIVSPIPGTTRDVVTISTAIDGYPVEIADMAGLRETTHPIEREGVARAKLRAFESDLTILVLDRSVPLDEPARSLIDSHGSQILVANKIDLEARWQPWNGSVIPISAERGDGFDRLIVEIRERLAPEPMPQGSAVPFRDTHRDALLKILDALARNQPETARSELATLLL